MTTPPPLRVLRGTDLLDLTFGSVGLAIENRLGRRFLVRADGATDGLLVVTFGPQHVLEEVFQEESPTPPASAPVGSLISGRSALVFEVGPDESVEYTEAGLLGAMRTLPLRVVDAAREPQTRTTIRFTGPGGTGARTADPAARATALVRLLRTTAELSARYGTGTTLAAARAAGADVETHAEPPAAGVPVAVRRTPQDPLADPAHPYTGIELPYRLLLSPSQRAHWIHRGTIDPAPGERVELWHTRFTTERPADRTVRAVWNRDRGPDPGAPETFPATLSGRNRTSLVDLTATDGLTTPEEQPYVPRPVSVENLMLSAVGGWLDSLGQWPERPQGVTLSEWRHRATLGRDHYVRLMFSGFLCPFGHRADLIQITERKFTDARAAYLFQRRFIVVREPLRSYDPGRELPIGDPERGPLANVQFPFTSVRIDTLVTPNLTNDLPTPDSCDFFPTTRAESPFRFKITAVDHQGRTVEFRTPLRFLTEDRSAGDQLTAIVDAYNALGPLPLTAADAAAEPAPETRADLLGQAVALAPGSEPDDTSLDVAHLVWGVAAPRGLASPSLRQAQFLPQVRWAAVTVPAVSQLSGDVRTVPVTYAQRYVQSGFRQVDAGLRKANRGEVFLNVLPVLGTNTPLTMDFSRQSDRSGGLSAPSFEIAGLSRKTGPVSGVAAGGADALESIADGSFKPADFFHVSDVIGALGANLLGILPLADLIKEAGLDQPLKVPNFFTETINAVTGFLSELRRIRDLIQNEAERYPAAGRRVVETAEALVKIIGDYLAQSLAGQPGPIELTDVDAAFNAFDAALTDLLNTLPPGADPGVRALLERVRQTVATWTNGAGQVISLRDALQKAAQGAKLPETVNARLEWNPEIKAFPAGNPVFEPHQDDQGRTIGRFSLVVDLRGSLRSDLTAGADVTCSLEEFDLILIPAFNAMRLNFERIRFTARAGKKLDVDVAFRRVEFIGPLSFVETLRQLIPIDGFSDPPGIQVTNSGIVASYALPLPNLAVGVFSLENLRLGAYLNLPFIGKSLEVGFSFCTRQAPFRLTVSMLGGGGFFGIVLTPKRVAVLEAALEFGAAVSMNFGVASGSLSVMAGIYFRLELDTGEARLSGYFRARGEVDVLGIVSASIELYLELTWRPGQVSGRAKITISIHIGFWSQSVTIECEKTFVGGGAPPPPLGPLAAAVEPVRPPTFAEMMSPYPDPVTGAERNPVDEYCTAFAEVS